MAKLNQSTETTQNAGDFKELKCVSEQIDDTQMSHQVKFTRQPNIIPIFH